MIKGTLKSIVAFFAVLVGGVVIFRREEVWKLFVVFYTQWSPELMGVILVSGIVLGGMLIFYLCKQKPQMDKLKEKKKYRERRERNQEKIKQSLKDNNNQ